jgi:hypothetical protein
LVTSLQSSVTGCARPVAALAGDTNEGAVGVPDAAGFTVRMAVRVAPYEPEIVAEAEEGTVCVVTVNVRLVVPAATVTLAGTVAADVLLLESVTTAPPDGAAPVSVTVPCDVFPPVTLVGLSDSAERVGADAAPAFTVSVVENPRWSSPEITTDVSDVTDVVEIGNVAVVAPAGTVTVAGSVAGDPPNSCTTAPPAGAGPWIVTVPVEPLPAATVAGESVRPTSGGVALAPGFTLSTTLAELAPYDAEMEAWLEPVTELLVMNANPVLVDPV